MSGGSDGVAKDIVVTKTSKQWCSRRASPLTIKPTGGSRRALIVLEMEHDNEQCE